MTTLATLNTPTITIPPQSGFVNQVTTMNLILNRNTAQAPWAINQCYHLTIPNPYKNVPSPSDVYQSFTTQNPPVCSSTTPGVTVNCTLQAGTKNSILFFFSSISQIQATASSIQVTIPNFNTPYSTVAITNVTVTSYSDTNCIQNPRSVASPAGLTFSAGIMDPATTFVSSSSKIIGDTSSNNSLIVSFTPNTTMSKSKFGSIRIGIPYLYTLDGGQSGVRMYSDTARNLCKSDCMTIQSSGLSQNELVINYSDMPQNCLRSTQITITCPGFLNPIWQSADDWNEFYVSFFDGENPNNIIETNNAQRGQVKLDSSKYTPFTIEPSQFIVTPSNYQVSSESTWDLSLTIRMPMETGCYITLELPVDINYNYQSLTASGMFYGQKQVDTLTTADFYQIIDNSAKGVSKIVFNGCYATSSLGAEGRGNVQISNLQIQPAVYDSAYFALKVYKDSDLTQLIAVLQPLSVNIPATNINTGVINSITMQPISEWGVQQKTILGLNFTTGSILYNDARVDITMPYGLTLPSVGTQIQVIGLNQTTFASSGIVLANNVIQIDGLVQGQATYLPAGYTFQLAIFSVTNQQSCQDAGGITISTFYKQTLKGGNVNFYPVDIGSSDTSYVAQKGQITASNQTGSVAIQFDNPLNSATMTTVTLRFTGKDSIPASGWLVIQIPSELTFNNQAITQTGNCSNLKCSVQGQTLTIQLSSQTSTPANNLITIIIGGITNPRSFKPTSSFLIQSYDVDGVSLIDEGFNQNIANSLFGSIQSFTFTQASFVNGALSTLTFQITTSIPIVVGDILSFTAPQQITLPSSQTNSGQIIKSSPFCNAVDPANQIFCGIAGSNVQITFQNIKTGQTSFSWVINNVVNPPSTQVTLGFTNIQITDSEKYVVAKYVGTTLGLQDTTAALISSAPGNLVFNQSSYIFQSQSNYTIQFLPTNPLPSTGSIVIGIPPQITLGSGQNTNCIVTTNRVFTGKNFCAIDTQKNQIVITNVFGQTKNYLTNIQIMLQNITNPVDNTPGLNGFTIQTYADAKQTYIQDQLPDFLLVPKLDCDYPCSSCLNSSRTLCTGCWINSPTINLQFLMLNQSSSGVCKTQCDFDYTTNGNPLKVCQACDQSCDGCEDQGKVGDNLLCLACNANFPFWIQGTQTCVSQCVQGQYQSSPTNCSFCDSNCQGCEGSATSCTSCNQKGLLPNLYNGKCIQTCPLGTVSIAGVCQPCRSPCKTCVGATQICTSCDGSDSRTLLVSGTCLASCPNGTVSDSSKLNCLACQPGCNRCFAENTTNCDVCNDGLFLLDGNCLGSCPAGYKQFGLVCVEASGSDMTKLWFPFCIATAIVAFVLEFGMCKYKEQMKDGKLQKVSMQQFWVVILIPFAIFQILCNISLFILAFLYGYILLSLISLIVAVIALALNICFACQFYSYFQLYINEQTTISKTTELKVEIHDLESKTPLKSIQMTKEEKLQIKGNDSDFSAFYKKNKNSTLVIFSFAAVINLKMIKLLYSHLYGYEQFKVQFSDSRNFVKLVNKYIIIQIFFVDLLFIIVGFIGLVTIKWDSQVFIECIEVIVLSVIGFILTLIEYRKLNGAFKYNDARLQQLHYNQSIAIKNKLRGSKKYGHRILLKKLDVLKAEFGIRQSVRSQWEITKTHIGDPRELKSWPSSPTTRNAIGLQMKKALLDESNNGLPFDLKDNVYADVFEKAKGKDRGTQGNTDQIEWQNALNRKHGDLMTQIDIDEEMRIRKGAKRRGRKNKYYNQIDMEDDEEVDYEEASDKDADLQIIKEQEEEEEMLRQAVALETQKQSEAVALRQKKLVQDLNAKESEEKAQAEARRLKMLKDDDRRREKELAEALKQEQEIQARKKLQEEAALESARRAIEEQLKEQEAILASQAARIKYEEEERARQAALEAQRLKDEELAAAKQAAEIEATNLAKQKMLEQMEKQRADNDAKQAELKRLALLEEDKRRLAEKEAQKLQKEQEDAQRKAKEESEKLAKLQAEKEAADQAKLLKDQAKKEQLEAKASALKAKEEEKKQAQEQKALLEAEKQRIQDEKNKKHDEDKALKIASQQPPAPSKQIAAPKDQLDKSQQSFKEEPVSQIPQEQADRSQNIKDNDSEQVEDERFQPDFADHKSASVKQSENSRPASVPQPKQEPVPVKESLPEPATSVVKKETEKKPLPSQSSSQSVVVPPQTDIYQASQNEKSLKHLRSLNQSEDIDNHSSMLEMNINALKDFKKPQTDLDVPPSAQLRTFNENDVLGDLDRDDKGNLVIQENRNGIAQDKQGNQVNPRGYCVDPKTGDIIEPISKQTMFAQDDLDDRGDLPAPFCLEKFNFNPHKLLGYFDFSDGNPLLLQTSKGFHVDKTGRRVNKKGWLTLAPQGHIVDKNGRKRFDKRQLNPDGDLPKLFTYGGKRFDIKDTMGIFERDQNGDILPHTHTNGTQLSDNLGRRVNQKGYLIDEKGNIIDVSGKQLFKVTDLKSGEFPKIFPFTKFNIQKVQGDFNLNPNGTPQLIKSKNGGLTDRHGRPVNLKGYLADAQGNIVDNLGNIMFDRNILEKDGEIPQVFRTGLLRSDTASSLSRLMSEIEKNNQSEFDRNPNAFGADSNYDKFRQHDGDTSMDSKMEDTPANYNQANQRFDERDDDPRDAIMEDEEGGEHYAASSGFEDNFQQLPKQKKLKKPKKRKPKVATIEFLEPTIRDKNMAGAYGGMAKGEIRRPGIKYDKERLANSKKFRVATADEPRVRAQLAQLASQMGAGFNPDVSLNNSRDAGKPKPRLQELLGNAFEDRDSSNSRSKKLVQNRSRRGHAETQKNQKGINDADFEQMFGKDIDKFLEDSEWDIQSADQVSQNSRNSGAKEVKIKAMEKVYLKRLEAQQEGMNDSTMKDRRSKLRSDSQSNSPPRTKGSPGRSKGKKPPVVGPPRETIISYTDNPGVIHRGEILPFETKKKWE